MWALNNKTPFAAERTWARDINGMHQWIVAVKASFSINPSAVQGQGELTLADEQSPPLMAPEYFGGPGQSSLKYDVDLQPNKPGTDIILNGTAYAPQEKPSLEFAVGLGVNGRRKVLKVTGERCWEKTVMGLKPSDPAAVTQVPIQYERAFGGWDKRDPDPARQKWDARNPVGCGLFSEQEGSPLHQFEYLNADARSSGPAGFGAIDSFWSPRRELTGTYDKHWQQHRHPLLPLDWQPRSLHCAPPDQQTEKPLLGGETIELFNLTPEGRLQFQLPLIYLTFTTHIDGRIVDHRAQMATVMIEPDLHLVKMVWTTVLPCGNDGDYLDQTIIRQKRYEQ